MTEENTISNTFGDIDKIKKVDKIVSFLLKSAKNRRVVFGLSIGTFDFIDKESGNALKGITLKCSDGAKLNQDNLAGINIEKHSILTNNTQAIFNKFKTTVPGPIIVEFSIKDSKTKLINMYNIKEFWETYEYDPLIENTYNPKDKSVPTGGVL